MIRNVLIFDLECTGLEPDEHQIIEVGYVLWSVEHRTVLECYSSLLFAESNDAEPFNAIPVQVLRGSAGVDASIVWEILAGAARQADCVVAHSAPFDRSFVDAETGKNEGLSETLEPLLKLPWLCTIEDLVWPIIPASRSLVNIALAHGVAVICAHRAINDCLLLARLFERIEDIDDRLHLAMQRAARPKARFIARTAYKDKDLVKAAGFHWDGTVWFRYMAIEDAEKLRFEVVNSAELSP